MMAVHGQDRPSLPCPECGSPLAPAEGRGFVDGLDGGEVTHHNKCRCLECDWRWSEPGPVYVCSCGVHAKVSIDHNTAYLIEVTPVSYERGQCE